jgi:hypothetical protein
VSRRAWLSYATIVLLQLKVVWGMWKYRDLSAGDTAGYFNGGYAWYESFSTGMAWSPLYTMFYGSLLHVSSHAYVATILHRLLIVFALTLLVLALMRRLLPSGIAWLVAAWWAVVPINFDALYEVHLFALIPVLGAWLLLTHASPWARGAALAVMLAASILVRNELLVPTLALGLICLVAEIRAGHREGPAAATRRRRLAPYLLPLAACGVLTGILYSRSFFPYSKLRSVMDDKHTVNMCQVYAYGHRQRHPEWRQDPWTQCYGLMESTFGSRLPSLVTMVKRNPRAVAEHVLWNLRLTPAGLQVLLFDAATGTVSPDYVPVQSGSRAALALSGAAGVLLLAGAYCLYRQRRFWWEHWLRERALPWIAILTTSALIAAVVIPTQRPRPSYLFSVSVALMALCGMAVFVIARRWITGRAATAAVALLMIGLPLFVPSYYPTHRKPRLLLEIYDRLLPFADLLGERRTVFLSSRYGDEAILYLGHNVRDLPMRSFNYEIFDDNPDHLPLPAQLARRGINLFYLDETIWTGEKPPRPYRRFLNASDESGWQTVAHSNVRGARWLLARRTRDVWYEDPAQLLARNGALDIAPAQDAEQLRATGTLPTDGLFLGSGWSDRGRLSDGQVFRRAEGEAEIVVTLPSGPERQLALVVEPASDSGAFTLRVVDEAGAVCATAPVRGRETVTVTLPLRPYLSTVFRLRADDSGAITPRRGHGPAFRVFRLGWV